jgi:zinc and cadmium transporter
MIWLSSIAAGLLVACVSWVGSFTFLIKPAVLNRYLSFFISFSVGILLGDAFLHLIPEAIDQTGDPEKVLTFVLYGIFGFFVLEKLVRWHHHHSHHGHLHLPEENPPKALVKMNLFGDAMHNFIDGMLIAGSFMASPLAGITTTFAIIVHEIPQEIGDVGALIYGGLSPRKALWYNFLSALTCVLGVIFLLTIGSGFEEDTVYFMPLAAGAFIYVATSDLIPELHRKNAGFKYQLVQALLLSFGLLVIYAIKVLENKFVALFINL